jgi:FdhE protein
VNRLNERVRTLVRLRPSHKDVLEFYGAILKEQIKVQEVVLPESQLKSHPGESRGDRKLPLFDGREFPVDLEAAKKLFRSLCHVAKGRNQTLQEGIEKIQRMVRSRKIDMDRFLGEMVLPDSPYVEEITSSHGINRDILCFLGRASIQPSLERAAKLCGEGSDLEEWSEGICPICGSLPLLSELAGQEGRKMLVCSRCEYRWRGSRMVCPFCGTEDHEAHRYFFVEGDKGVRIDVCDKCKKYIKTIDSRETGQKTFPLLEYVGTLHLDMLAQERGYHKGSIPFLEIG